MRNGTTRVRHRTVAEFTSARSGTGSLADPLSPMDRWAEPSIITRIFSETVGQRPCLTEPPAPVGTSHLVFSCSGIAAASGGQRPPTKEWRAVAGEPRRPPAPSGALRCPASPPQRSLQVRHGPRNSSDRARPRGQGDRGTGWGSMSPVSIKSRAPRGSHANARLRGTRGDAMEAFAKSWRRD
jgi:hypothetical protein